MLNKGGGLMEVLQIWTRTAKQFCFNRSWNPWRCMLLASGQH